MEISQGHWQQSKDRPDFFFEVVTSFSRKNDKKEKKKAAWQLESGEFDGANGLKLHRLHCSIA